MTLCSALSIAEIASNIPRAGGLYTYLEELYGEKWGFLLGWVQSIISYPASVAAQGIAFATYASVFLPASFGENAWAMRGLAIGVMVFVLVMNVLSTRCGGFIQVAATTGKLIPIVAILGIGLFGGAMPGAGGMSMVLIGEGKANGGRAKFGMELAQHTAQRQLLALRHSLRPTGSGHQITVERTEYGNHNTGRNKDCTALTKQSHCRIGCWLFRFHPLFGRQRVEQYNVKQSINRHNKYNTDTDHSWQTLIGIFHLASHIGNTDPAVIGP